VSELLDGETIVTAVPVGRMPDNSTLCLATDIGSTDTHRFTSGSRGA
jgi:hypothetical protein